MPHQRNRHILNLVLKRLKLWPVLALLGPRQVGKSTLLRDQLSQKIGAHYVTLDDKNVRSTATKRPGRFIESFQSKPVVIDEVQKAPDLFDAIKVVVDTKRQPGRFVLSGSTEFSKKTGIRESLTGRIGLLRLYPMTLAETLEQARRDPWVRAKPITSPVSMPEVMRRVKIGGMPGICFLRSEEERSAAWAAWLDTTCYRDLQQIRGAKLSGYLALEILQELVKLEEPTITAVANQLNQDARRIRSHIEALEALFVLSRLNPHRSGTGKDQYYLCDSGLALHLGANEMTQLKIWSLNECLSQYESDGTRPKLTYYRSSNKSLVDLIIEDKKSLRAFVFTDDEAPSTYIFRTAEALLKKLPAAHVAILAPTKDIFHETKQLSVVPWTAMA